jgi:hypothetical protein
MVGNLLFAYVGPDTFLPVTSVLSAVAGVVMLAWGTGVRSIARGFGARFRRGPSTGIPAPAFARVRRPADAPTARTSGDMPPARAD